MVSDTILYGGVALAAGEVTGVTNLTGLGQSNDGEDKAKPESGSQIDIGPIMRELRGLRGAAESPNQAAIFSEIANARNTANQALMLGANNGKNGSDTTVIKVPNADDVRKRLPSGGGGIIPGVIDREANLDRVTDLMRGRGSIYPRVNGSQQTQDPNGFSTQTSDNFDLQDLANQGGLGMAIATGAETLNQGGNMVGSGRQWVGDNPLAAGGLALGAATAPISLPAAGLIAGTGGALEVAPEAGAKLSGYASSLRGEGDTQKSGPETTQTSGAGGGDDGTLYSRAWDNVKRGVTPGGADDGNEYNSGGSDPVADVSNDGSQFSDVSSSYDVSSGPENESRLEDKVSSQIRRGIP